jgi:hypothetical protein
MRKNQVGNMKKNRCLNLISIIALNLASTVAISAVEPAPASAQRTSQINAPLVCNRGDMTDGLVKWKFVTHQYGSNYYRAQEVNGSRWNNVSCRETLVVKGRWLPGEKTCIIAGIVALPGAFIPGVGVVGYVYAAGTTCLVSIIDKITD